MTEGPPDGGAGRGHDETASGEPYPPAVFRPTERAAELHATYGALADGEGSGDDVSVAGRVMARRDSGKLVFLVLRDQSGEIQVFCSASDLGDGGIAAAKGCVLGDWMGARGEVIRTKRGELSVRAAELAPIAKAARPLPDKWHGLADPEIRHRRRYLDFIANEEARRAIEVRAEVLAGLRRRMVERRFLEVETPVLQPLPGGAAAKPFSARYEALDTEVFLRIAPELYLKRMLVGGFERIFEIGRCFRNEGISTRHNPEFTMLEAYQAHADYADMMELVEHLISGAAEDVLGATKITYDGKELDLTPPWRRVTLLGAASEAAGEEIDLAMGRDAAAKVAERHGLEAGQDWGVGKIAFFIYDKLAEGRFWDPVLVTDFPAEVSPLARSHRDRPGLAERFEAVIAGRELANAFTELNDPAIQRERLEAQARMRASGDDEAMPVDEDFLLALEHGMPPAGGMGLGVDRLVMLVSNQTSIREVLAFPQLRPEQPRDAGAGEAQEH